MENSLWFFGPGAYVPIFSWAFVASRADGGNGVRGTVSSNIANYTTFYVNINIT